MERCKNFAELFHWDRVNKTEDWFSYDSYLSSSSWPYPNESVELLRTHFLAVAFITWAKVACPRHIDFSLPYQIAMWLNFARTLRCTDICPTWRFFALGGSPTWSFSPGVSHLEFLRLGGSFPTWSFFQLEFIWLGISPTWGFFSNSKFLTIRVYLTCNFSDLVFVWLGICLTCSFFSNSKFLQLRVSLTWSFFFFSNSEFLTLGISPNWSFNDLEFLRLEFSTTWNFSRLEFLGVSPTFR